MDTPQGKPAQARRVSIFRRVPWPLLCLGYLVVLVGLFYAEEDWRGRRAWNQYRKAVEARGDHLDFKAYIPKTVPEEENFAATTIPRSWMQNVGSSLLPNDLYARAVSHVYSTNGLVGHRHFTDLVAWQMAAEALQDGPLDSKSNFATVKTDLKSREAAAPVVLEGMKTNEYYFAELRQASARPYSRFFIDYNHDPYQISLAHLSRVKQACQHLNLQACAELAASQPDKALGDVKLMLYLTDSIKTDPFLICYLVRVACIQLAVQAVWEGLAEHRWTESQLPELESCLQNYDFPNDLARVLKPERAYGVGMVAVIEKKGLSEVDGFDYVNLFAAPGTALELGARVRKASLNLLGKIAPAGWFDWERLHYSAFFDMETEGVVDSATGRILPGRQAFNDAEVVRQLLRDLPMPLAFILHHQAVAAAGGPTIPATFSKAAIAQTVVNQAATACALERYRLANGQFPDKLEALAPQFISRLPDDVLTGQPYKYRRTDDGKFVLYSVGWNEKDDGGVPGKNLFDKEQGDWVWDYPRE
jgi:hypothetical protein